MDNKNERYPYEDNVGETLKEIKNYINGIKSGRVRLVEGDAINTKESFKKLIASKLKSAEYLNRLYGFEPKDKLKDIYKLIDESDNDEFDHFLSEIEALIDGFC